MEHIAKKDHTVEKPKLELFGSFHFLKSIYKKKNLLGVFATTEFSFKFNLGPIQKLDFLQPMKLYQSLKAQKRLFVKHQKISKISKNRCQNMEFFPRSSTVTKQAHRAIYIHNQFFI